MTLRQWFLGCLNSAIQQSAKLGLVVLTAFTVGSHLDIKTLGISISVGFLWGIGAWFLNNPIPDDSTTITSSTVKTITVKPSATKDPTLP